MKSTAVAILVSAIALCHSYAMAQMANPIAEKTALSPLNSVIDKARKAEIPVLFPSTNSIPASQWGKLYILDNKQYRSKIEKGSYEFWMGTSVDCETRVCLVGTIHAVRGNANPPGACIGKRIKITKTVTACYLKSEGNSSVDSLEFHLDGVNYGFELGFPPRIAQKTMVSLARSAIESQPR